MTEPHDLPDQDKDDPNRSAWVAFIGRPIIILFAAAALGTAVLIAFDVLWQG